MLLTFLARLASDDQMKQAQKALDDPHSLVNLVLAMAGPNFRVLDWLLTLLAGGDSLMYVSQIHMC
jgi:hypothetical protein